jgi:hypothetical protein
MQKGNRIEASSVIVAVVGLICLLSLRNSYADENWKKKHPRRAEVNKRLNNQNKRINQGVKSGKLTEQQAQQLKQEDNQIRQEERAMAAQNGGHITKAEQKSLNQQENAVSKEIYQEKHAGQTPAAPAGK